MTDLGNAYRSLGDFHRAIQYHKRDLMIAKEVSDRAGEGRAYGNLGNANHSLGQFQRVLECHKQDLSIAKEVSDKAAEGRYFSFTTQQTEHIMNHKVYFACFGRATEYNK